MFLFGPLIFFFEDDRQRRDAGFEFGARIVVSHFRGKKMETENGNKKWNQGKMFPFFSGTFLVVTFRKGFVLYIGLKNTLENMLGSNTGL